MRVFVTGGAGYIGSVCVEELLNAGHEVSVFDNLSEGHRQAVDPRAGFVNGLPGFITLEADGELQTTALDIEDGKIAAIYVVRNPDKLRHLH